jgi:hypothetical protein
MSVDVTGAERAPRSSGPGPGSWELAAAGVLVAVALGALGFGIAAGWPGTETACAHERCWCEALQPGPVREPWNTFSNLPLFGLCFFVAARACAERRRGRRRANAVLVTFAYALWLQGTGALLYHASLVGWTSVIDGASVLAIWGALASTSLLRLFRAPPRLLCFIVPAALVAAFAYRLGVQTEIEVPGFFLMLFTLGMEPVILFRQRAPRRLRELAIGFAAFLGSVLVWNLALPGRAWCEAAFPWHAAWHILAGLAVVFFGLHAAENAQRDARSR